jgi:predicted DNA-binding protein (MmcQ/YjbR family)
MDQKAPKSSALLNALRTFALSLPETDEGIACEGTSLEKRTIKVRKKAFVFLGKTDVMFKLSRSLSDATAIAKESPDFVKAGATGWVTIKLEGSPVSRPSLEGWIKESYQLFAGAPSASKSKAKLAKKSGR